MISKKYQEQYVKHRNAVHQITTQPARLVSMVKNIQGCHTLEWSSVKDYGG